MRTGAHARTTAIALRKPAIGKVASLSRAACAVSVALIWTAPVSGQTVRVDANVVSRVVPVLLVPIMREPTGAARTRVSVARE
eukprot:scaffold274952_cov30-Tisochrysis_lutea.AAC.1